MPERAFGAADGQLPSATITTVPAPHERPLRQPGAACWRGLRTWLPSRGFARRDCAVKGRRLRKHEPHRTGESVQSETVNPNLGNRSDTDRRAWISAPSSTPGRRPVTGRAHFVREPHGDARYRSAVARRFRTDLEASCAIRLRSRRCDAPIPARRAHSEGSVQSTCGPSLPDDRPTVAAAINAAQADDRGGAYRRASSRR